MADQRLDILNRVFSTSVEVVSEERRRILPFRGRIFSTVEQDGDPLYAVENWGVGLMGEHFLTWQVMFRLLEETDWRIVSEPRPVPGGKWADLRVYLTSKEFIDIEFKHVKKRRWGDVRKELANPGLSGILVIWEAHNPDDEIPEDLEILDECLASLEDLEGLPYCRIALIDPSQ